MFDRKSVIAKIKIAQKQLDMADDAYRAMLVRVAGADSCAKMTPPQLEAVLAEMRRMGFVPQSKRHTRPNCRPTADALMGKIGALLADMSLPWAYAHQMAKHMYGPHRVEWLDNRQMRGVIAALSKRQAKLKEAEHGS